MFRETRCLFFNDLIKGKISGKILKASKSSDEFKYFQSLQGPSCTNSKHNQKVEIYFNNIYFFNRETCQETYVQS